MPKLKHLREELDELGVEPSTPAGSSPMWALDTRIKGGYTSITWR
jgi:hypothetical protein